MKISIIGPGIMPIPPTGWGAVEILIWDSKLALESLGHEVQIVNTKDPQQIINEIKSLQETDNLIELEQKIKNLEDKLKNSVASN